MPKVSLKKEVIFSLVAIFFLSVTTVKLSREVGNIRDIRSKAFLPVSTIRPLGQQILAVTFEYQPEEKIISVKKISVGQGTLRENTVNDPSHALIASVTDSNGQTIYTTIIKTNDEISYEPPLTPYPPGKNPPPSKLEKVTLSVKIPYQIGSKLIISLPSDEILAEIPITQVNQTTALKENNKLKTLTVESFGGGGLVPLETIYDGNPSETDPTKMVDWIILPSGYTQNHTDGKMDFDDLRNHAQGSINWLIGENGKPGKSPFNLPANKAILRVKIVLTEEIFHDQNSSVDFSKIYQFLTDQQINYDKFILFVPINDRSYSTLDGDWFVLFTGSPWAQNDIPLVFIHELGHAFGGLDDEYTESATCAPKNYNYDMSTINPYNIYDWRESNCQAGEQTPWLENLDAPHLIECHNSRYLFKSSKDSMMNYGVYQDLTFNEVSQKLIQRKFDKYSTLSNLIVTPKKQTLFMTTDNLKTYTYSIYINQSGKTILPWTATSSATTWIHLKHFSGETPSFANFEIYPGGLSPGNYEASVTISQTDDPQKQFIVPISLKIFAKNVTLATPQVQISGDLKNGPATVQTNLTGNTGDIFWVDYYAQRRDGCKIAIGQKTQAPNYTLRWNFVDTQRRMFGELIDSIVAVAQTPDGRKIESTPLKVHDLTYHSSPGPSCDGDVNIDDIVNVNDLQEVESHLGQIEGKDINFSSAYDISSLPNLYGNTSPDGIINQYDVNRVNNDLGQQCKHSLPIWTAVGWNHLKEQGQPIQGLGWSCNMSSKIKSIWKPYVSQYEGSGYLKDYPLYPQINDFYLHCSL